MTHGEGTLTTAAGDSLYCQSWKPAQTPKAALLIVHGLAEHSGRYHHFAQFFVERGFAVYSLDLPGHGKSDGVRCHIGRFSEFAEGVRLLLDSIRIDRLYTPIFLVGHSMGGLIAAQFLLERQSDLAGCVLSGAAIKPAAEPPLLQGLIVRLLSKLLPKIRVMQLDSSGVSRDPIVVERYRNDPLVFTGKVTARLAKQIFSAMAALEAKLNLIELPMLILHGSADRLTHPEGSKMLHDRISSKDKKLIIYEGLYHEVYNEPEQNDVMADVSRWLTPRLKSHR